MSDAHSSNSVKLSPQLKKFASKGRDRRLAHRVLLEIPLAFRPWKSPLPEQQVNSLNLSKGGVYFASSAPIERGAAVQVRLRMPAEISDDASAEWNCTGHVVRVESISSDDSLLGIGVRFDYYEVA